MQPKERFSAELIKFTSALNVIVVQESQQSRSFCFDALLQVLRKVFELFKD